MKIDPVRVLAAQIFLLTTVGAHAQSSVTLYGSVDAGLIYTTNQQVTHTDGTTSGKTNYQLGGGNLMPSRWGIMGTEDLGGGTQAKFMLENNFFTGTGQFAQAGALFNRSAWVGLSNETFGSLTLGRQYDPFSDFLGQYASSNSWATLYGSHFGDVDNLNEAFNFNNSIKYLSPTWGGFSVGAQFSLGGVAGSFSQNKGWSVGTNYSNGPLTLSLGYLELNNPLEAALGGANYIGDFSCSNPDAAYCNLQEAARVRVAGIGGSYAFSKVTVALSFTHTLLSNSQYFAKAGNTDGEDISFNIFELNTTYQPSPDFQLGFAYIFNQVKPSGMDSTRVQQINLGANYSLSKRTGLYVITIAQQSSGLGIGIDPINGGFKNLAQIPNLTNSNSNKQLAVIAGIKQSF
ncbi:porin [Paraburkholderia sp. D1E]|uniref:porin n=1 Tax=Paraburkholderia sp. D1E TaxID=3461398 RepID=UPI0040466752